MSSSRQPLRVLFCTWDFAPGPTAGGERQALLQAEELIRRGHTVDVVCPAHRQPTGKLGEITVHRLRYVARVPLHRVTYALALSLFLLRRLRTYDVVHVHWVYAHTAPVVFWARLLRRPVHLKPGGGGDEFVGRRDRRLLFRRWATRRADSVQALSTEIESTLRRMGVRDDRIVRIPNGVSHDWTDPPAARTGARTVLTVLYVGRLDAPKGIADLLAAWQQMTDLDAELVLLGVRPTDAFTLPPNVGRVRVEPWGDPRPYLVDADVFVLPSHVEGMSNALLEAMAYGKPPLVTEVGAAEELLEHGTCGLLVPVNDSAALAGALRTLLTDPALRTTLGRAAQRRSRDFRIETVVDALEDTYLGMIRRDQR